MSLNYAFIIDLASTLVAQPARFLDFGCGSAELAEQARTFGYDAYGADTFMGIGDDAANYTQAQRRLGDHAIAIAADGTMPFADAYFDIAVANQVFEHVADIASVKREMARIIKPGGFLVALMPAAETWWEPHLKMPFIHWMKGGTMMQNALVRVLRKAGMGTRPELDHDAWLAFASHSLRDIIFYRSTREYLRQLEPEFRLHTRAEPAWARYRLAHDARSPLKGRNMQFPWLDPALRWAVTRTAGCVLVLQKL